MFDLRGVFNDSGRLFKEKVRVTWEVVNDPIILTTCGVIIGILLVTISGSKDKPLPANVPAAAQTPIDHRAQLEGIINGHLNWAGEQDHTGLAPGAETIHAFFDQAKTGTPRFAKEVLGWESKWKLASDYVSGGKEHEQYIADKFGAWVFSTEQLEKLIESTITAYLQHLNDVDSQLLVRLEADLSNLPYDAFSSSVDRDAIGQVIGNAIRQAVQSVEADFQGAVRREIVSFVAGEVLAMAATRLATSAGIIGVGAGSGTVTLGVGIVVGVIVDYCVSWAYDKMYDPAGEISKKLNETLLELEYLILQGDGSQPGLQARLAEYARRRGEARTLSIRSAVLQ